MPDTTSPTVYVNSTGLQVTWDHNTGTITNGIAPFASSSGTLVMGSETASPPEEPAPEPEMGEEPWSGPVAYENRMTGDGRIFSPGAIGWLADSLPWPLRWTPVDNGGHDGAVVIGRVNALSRNPDAPGVIYATGVIFTGDNAPPASGAYLALLSNGAAGGVSVDGDMAEFSVVEKTNADGELVGLEQHFSQMRLRTMTAVDVPAFIDACISLDNAGPATDNAALIAAAIPVHPPVEWFDKPLLDGPTPITISEDGWVFGHLALFGTCHLAMPQGCVTPPRGDSFSHFHTGEIKTANGALIAVGHLTFGTGHADMAANGRAAASHYDDTGTVAADVCAGEDEHGIWVAGALRSGLSDEEIREFRAAPLSGDWRRIGGRLSLVAALAVNVPGFPVPRTRARVLVASGLQQAVIATVPPDEFEPNDDDRRAMKQSIANSVAKAGLSLRVAGKGGQ